MSNEIQTISSQNEVTQQLLLDYLKNTNSHLQPNEQAQFLAIASAYGLNPWKREVYAVAYGKDDKRKFSIIVGYETYLRRAETFPQYDGYDVEFGTENNIITCTCKVYRKDRSRPTISKVYLNEYHQGNTMWNTKPHVMLEKVAICTAMRRAFPDEMGGMPYAEDEMPSGAEKLTQQGLTEVQSEVVKDSEEESYIKFTKAMEKMQGDAPDVFGSKMKEMGYTNIGSIPADDRHKAYITIYNAICEMFKAQKEAN